MNIPNGTVTFLFTDIEDSTKLAQEFPDTLHELLNKHNSVLREAIESNNGFVFKTVENAFCSAFENAADAVKAAVDAQIKFNSEEWNEAALKVRMGINTGNAEWDGSDYMGYVTLASSQRIMSSAYGGQILISDTTYNELKDKIPQGITFRDFGKRMLKDLKEPVRIHQIISDGLRSNFQPLVTPDARPNNLPVQLTSFIGREKELSEIKNLLKSSRLLTLLGPGGTGKTRLSIQTGNEVTDEFENGVRIIELASLNDPPLILNEISNVLKLKSDGSRDLTSVIIDYLKEKQLLLILDNCEHLVNECAKISKTLLNSCPNLKIIASSRESLRIPGESVFHVPALSLPGGDDKISIETLDKYEAVRLFIDRAISVKSDFEVTNQNIDSIAELCTQLDGIPLAIELAAARIKVFSVEKILDNISNRFKLLTGGSRTALPRQQTLRALIDWSYDLLLEKEKLLFVRLSVFSGGWSLEAAEEVCSEEGIEEFEILDLMTNLIDKSIVISKEAEGITRYTMLETIRQYSLEKLNSNVKFYKKHFDYFFKLASKLDPLAPYISKEKWIIEMDLEEDNLRAAIRWGLNNSYVGTSGFILNVAEYYEIKGNYTEAYDLLKRILDVNYEIDGSERATALVNAGYLASQHDENEIAEKYVRQGLEYFVSVGNKVKTSNALSILGIIFFLEGNSEDAIKYTRESLKLLEGMNEKILEANTKSNLAAFNTSDKSAEESINLIDDAIEIYREYGQIDMMARLLISKGGIYYQEGDYKNAELCFNEGLPILIEVNDQYSVASTLYNLGNLNFALNKYSESAKFFEESMIKSKEYGYTSTFDRAYIKLGEIALIKNERHNAKEIFISCLKSFNKNSERLKLILSIYGLGNYYFLEKNYELSARYFLLAEKINEEMKFKLSKWRKDENEKIILELNKELQDSKYNLLKAEISKLKIENAAEAALGMIAVNS